MLAGAPAPTCRCWIGPITAPILKKVSSELLTLIDQVRVRLRDEGFVPIDERSLFGRVDANDCHSKSDHRSDRQSQSTVWHDRLHPPRRCDRGTLGMVWCRECEGRHSCGGGLIARQFRHRMRRLNRPVSATPPRISPQLLTILPQRTLSCGVCSSEEI